MKRILNVKPVIILLFLTGCTAHYPVNEPITVIDEEQGYRLEETHVTDRADDLIVIVAFSGGGTRAAAFSYGILEALRDTTINWNGSDRRLLDEVDTISSVSGGSQFHGRLLRLVWRPDFRGLRTEISQERRTGTFNEQFFKPLYLVYHRF